MSYTPITEEEFYGTWRGTPVPMINKGWEKLNLAQTEISRLKEDNERLKRENEKHNNFTAALRKAWEGEKNQNDRLISLCEDDESIPK